MFDRYTDRSRRAVVLAQEEARLHHHSRIGSEHLLLGLIHEGESLAYQVLKSMGLDLDRARKALKEGDIGFEPSSVTPFTARAKKILELALRESLQIGTNYVAPEHILLGLLREGEGEGIRILVDAGLDLGQVRKATIEAIVNAARQRPDVSITMSAITADALTKWARMMNEVNGPYADNHPAMLLLKALTGESA